MNNLYFGDNLDVLQQKIKDEFVDLVYLDPNSIPTLIITCCSGHLGARGRSVPRYLGLGRRRRRRLR